MRIGYHFRGFLGDVKLDAAGNELSTPDGNATYSWSIEHECNRRGYRLIPLGENLDAPAAKLMDVALFKAFSGDNRARSYERMLKYGWSRLSDREFPELDLVLLEWRWPIAGRNTQADRDAPGYQRDLERQNDLLWHYLEKGTPVVVWDLDHKLAYAEEDMWGLDNVIETSAAPTPRSGVHGRPARVRVEPPTVVADLLQHDIDERLPTHHLGYVGSRYERDGVIDEWIAPIGLPNAHRVKFWGKWEPLDECKARWPGVSFAGRIGVREFYQAYSRVAACPLLAKPSYFATGFITPRVWEAILFGSVPIGLSPHLGIEGYVDRVADSPQRLLELATEVRNVSPIRRRVIREEAAHRLSHMDARHFVDVLEGLASRLEATDARETEKETENGET